MDARRLDLGGRGDHLLGDDSGDDDGEVGRLLLGLEAFLDLLTGPAHKTLRLDCFLS